LAYGAGDHGALSGDKQRTVSPLPHWCEEDAVNDLQGYYRELTAKLKALADSTPVRKVEEARQRALNELLEKIQSSDLRERVEETFHQQQRSFVDFARAVQGVLSAQQQAVAELISQWERDISERLPSLERRDIEDEDEVAPFPPPPAAVSALEPAAKKTAAKKTAAKKTTKKAPAKKAAAKKTPAKKTEAKKTAKKTAAKKAPTKKAPTKKTAKKATKKAAPPSDQS
jgi:hypothetical protein